MFYQLLQWDCSFDTFTLLCHPAALKLNSEILVSCVHCNQPSFILLESTLPFIRPLRCRRETVVGERGLLPSPQHTRQMPLWRQDVPSLPLLRSQQRPETAAAFSSSCLQWAVVPWETPLHHMIHDAGRWFLSQVCSEGSLETCKELWSENFRVKLLLWSGLCLPFPPGSLWEGMASGADGRVPGGAVQSTEQSVLLCPNAFSVWIIGPFREVAWKWLDPCLRMINQGATCEKGSSRSWGLAALDHKTRPRCPQPWLPAGTRAFIHIELTQQGALSF